MRFGFLQTVESTDGLGGRSAYLGIALCQLFARVMEFGVYGEVEDDSEGFRWEELETRRRCVWRSGGVCLWASPTC